MDPIVLTRWIDLLSLAARLGEDVLALILDHARRTMTDTEYADLELRWYEDAARAARNAGIVS